MQRLLKEECTEPTPPGSEGLFLPPGLRSSGPVRPPFAATHFTKGGSGLAGLACPLGHFQESLFQGDPLL